MALTDPETESALTHAITVNSEVGLLTPVELTQDPGSADTFLGPHRFVAILSSRFYIIDEDETDAINNNERIVAFDDLTSNWDPLVPTSIGQTEFGFFGMC